MNSGKAARLMPPYRDGLGKVDFNTWKILQPIVQFLHHKKDTKVDTH